MTFYPNIFQSLASQKNRSIYCCSERMIVVIMYGFKVCRVLFMPGTTRTKRLLCVRIAYIRLDLRKRLKTICLIVWDINAKLLSSPKMIYSVPDCKEAFFDHIPFEQRRIAAIMGENFEMLHLTREEQARYNASTFCNCCKREYTTENRKVRHHNRQTSLFIDAVWNACSLQLTPRKRRRIWQSKTIKAFRGRSRNSRTNEDSNDYECKFYVPIIFHNLRGYDA